MAIALDATAAATNAIVDTLTISSFTGTSGSLIRVDILAGTNVDCTGVTYNGQSLTEVHDANLAGAGVVCRVASYIGIAGVDGSAHDVVVTWAATVNGAVCARVSTWTGAEMSSVGASHRTIYSAGDGGGGAGADVTVTDSQSGDVVVSMNATAATSITNVETLVGIDNNVAGDGKSFGVQYKTATGANTSMTWTGDNFCTAVAYALVPEGAGGGVVPRNRLNPLNRNLNPGLN